MTICDATCHHLVNPYQHIINAICHHKELRIPESTGGHIKDMNASSLVKPACISWVSCNDVFRQQHPVMTQMCISSSWSWQATSPAARDWVMI